MKRREFITRSVIAAAAGAGMEADLAAATRPTPAAGAMIAVMAELAFAPAHEAAAAAALDALALATRAEPGCRRYVVGRDVGRPGHFHLSELWDDLAALAAHFRTSHMAAFSATARGLGYSAPFMQRIDITAIEPLDTRALARL